MKKNNTGTYLIFDRLFYLMNCDFLIKENYCEKYNISKTTFFRDLEHLRDFYDIEFHYDRFYKRFEKVNNAGKFI